MPATPLMLSYSVASGLPEYVPRRPNTTAYEQEVGFASELTRLSKIALAHRSPFEGDRNIQTALPGSRVDHRYTSLGLFLPQLVGGASAYDHRLHASKPAFSVGLRQSITQHNQRADVLISRRGPRLAQRAQVEQHEQAGVLFATTGGLNLAEKMRQNMVVGQQKSAFGYEHQLTLGINKAGKQGRAGRYTAGATAHTTYR